MHTKCDLQTSHIVDLAGECQASENVNDGVGDPEPLLVVVLDRESRMRDTLGARCTYHSDHGHENNHGQKGERARRTRIDIWMPRLVDLDDIENGNDKHEARVELKILLRWADVITARSSRSVTLEGRVSSTYHPLIRPSMNRPIAIA